MTARTVQLVLHYDGSRFSGWQRQPSARTVQGVLEDTLSRLCNGSIPVLGAGRTDAGVHARGQAAGIRLPERWTAAETRRALNAVLPDDIWVAAAYEMCDRFHARYDAVSRRYTYQIGIDESSRSPFRNHHEWSVGDICLGLAELNQMAATLVGEHCFRAFAVQGTAPATDSHLCTIKNAEWQQQGGSLYLQIEANRFLHHMVRFLVGTMVEVARGRRKMGDLERLLAAPNNSETPAPAPAHGLFLDAVIYPCELYA
jgi:tRNA pseudouridine38-40 synthase